MVSVLLIVITSTQDLRPIFPPEKTTEDILLFFKLYDPETEALRYCRFSYTQFLAYTRKYRWCYLLSLSYIIRFLGRLFVKGSGMPSEILSKLKEMAGFAPDEEMDLYEVEN